MRAEARTVGGFRLMGYRSPHLPWWSCQRYPLLVSHSPRACGHITPCAKVGGSELSQTWSLEIWSMDRGAVLSLWETHKTERWPQVGNQQEGPLMTLDTVISGCVVYFLDSPEGLDAQRISIVEDCVADLDSLIDELDEDCLPYFQRLRHLGALLITTHHTT